MSDIPSASSTSPSTITAQQLQWLEREINVFFFSMYRVGKDDRHLIDQQAALLTMDGKTGASDELRSAVETIGQRTGKKRQAKLMTQEDLFSQEAHHTRPLDSAVLALDSGLVAARRSPETGELFYEDTYDFCPVSGQKLKPVVAADRTST